MRWTQRAALALLAFAFAGLGLIVWQPQGHATMPAQQQSYFLAISSGAGLKLGHAATQQQSEPALSCARVFNLGSIEIGSRCIAQRSQGVVTR